MRANLNFLKLFSPALIALSLITTGCSTVGKTASLTPAMVSAMSPAPEAAAVGAAARLAREYVAAHPGTQIALANGDSMLPVYRDNTVLVIERRPIGQLKPGMTAVFNTAQGWVVAHALVEHDSDGWTTKGLANADVDSAPMTDDNYIGIVVRAFEMDSNPMLALSQGLKAPATDAVLAQADTARRMF